MVDIPLLIHLLSPLESLLKRLRAAGQPLSNEGVRLLRQSADVVDEVMAQFDAAHPQLPDASALIARLDELRDHQPEPQIAHVVFEPHSVEPEHIEHVEAETHVDPVEAAPVAEETEEAPASALHAEPVEDDYTAELLEELSRARVEPGCRGNAGRPPRSRA